MMTKRVLCLFIVFLLLLLAGPQHVVAVDADGMIYDPTLVIFRDIMVILNEVDLETQEGTITIIFTDNSAFFSTTMFQAFFEIMAEVYINSGVIDDIEIAKIVGFGTVNETGYFGEWSPKGGYKYYPLT